MTFDNIVNNLLNEIPYINYINKFDFELEKRQDVNMFLQFLLELFNGEEKIDKYDNRIKLSTPEEKKFFMNSLLSDPIIVNWVKKQDLESSKKIKDFFKGLISKISEKKPRSQYF